jgi:hypothetical protein
VREKDQKKRERERREEREKERKKISWVRHPIIVAHAKEGFYAVVSASFICEETNERMQLA